MAVSKKITRKTVSDTIVTNKTPFYQENYYLYLTKIQTRMKKYLVAIAIAAVVMCGCRRTEVEISGKFLGLNAKTVYLERSSVAAPALLDSVELAPDGSYRFVVSDVPATPTIYNLVYNNERIPLLLSGGESLTVGSLGSVALNYTVSGSHESEFVYRYQQEPYCSHLCPLSASFGRAVSGRCNKRYYLFSHGCRCCHRELSVVAAARHPA